MKSDDDLIAAEIVRQSRLAAMGNRLSAGSSGNAARGASTTTIVDGTGNVRREFLVGDDFSSRFYFKEYQYDA